MSAPKFYYWPEGTGLLETVDFTGVVSDCNAFEPGHRVEREDGRSQTGRVWSSVSAVAPRARILIQRFPGYTTAGGLVVRGLRALIEHLRDGGLVCFARDQGKTWAAFATGAVSQADSTIHTRPEIFNGALESSPAPAASDELWLLGGYPQRKREAAAVSSWTSAGRLVTLTRGLRYDYAEPCLLRHSGFVPLAYLPADQRNAALLTSDRDRIWTLDLTLEIDTGRLEALANQGDGQEWATATTPGLTPGQIGLSSGKISTGGLYSTRGG